MIIDSHIHIGDKKWCKETINNSKYKDYYRIYSCINPDVIDDTKEYIKDLDNFFAIPLFFCETDIQSANKLLLDYCRKEKKAIPILLLPKNDFLKDLDNNMSYRILKEHFTLHNPNDITDRNEVYDYLSEKEGFLLVHTLSNMTRNHIQKLRDFFPNMNIIIAHLGRNSICDYNYTKDMIDFLSVSERNYTDISTIKNPLLIRYAIDKFGKERVLYGSDFPFECSKCDRVSNHIKYAMEANLTSDEYEHIFYKNASRTLRLSKRSC